MYTVTSARRSGASGAGPQSRGVSFWCSSRVRVAGRWRCGPDCAWRCRWHSAGRRAISVPGCSPRSVRSRRCTAPTAPTCSGPDSWPVWPSASRCSWRSATGPRRCPGPECWRSARSPCWPPLCVTRCPSDRRAPTCSCWPARPAPGWPPNTSRRGVSGCSCWPVGPWPGWSIWPGPRSGSAVRSARRWPRRPAATQAYIEAVGTGAEATARHRAAQALHESWKMLVNFQPAHRISGPELTALRAEALRLHVRFAEAMNGVADR